LNEIEPREGPRKHVAKRAVEVCGLVRPQAQEMFSRIVQRASVLDMQMASSHALIVTALI